MLDLTRERELVGVVEGRERDLRRRRQPLWMDARERAGKGERVGSVEEEANLLDVPT